MQVTHYFCDHCGEEQPPLKSFHVELNGLTRGNYRPIQPIQPAQQAMYGLPGPPLPQWPLLPDVQFTAQLCEKHYNEAVAMLRVVQGWALEKATPEAKD